jgi:hypothetical protein
MTYAMLQESPLPFVLGVLPLAIVLWCIIAARLGAIVFHDAAVRLRLLGGATLALGALVLSVRVLGAFGALDRRGLLALLAGAAGSLSGVRRWRSLGLKGSGLVSLTNAPTIALGAAALTACMLVSYLLPVWQWDALGYHLPYVNFALQSAALAGVPPDIFYISTYPHVVESFFLVWRAMLPDDRLIDFAQVPLGVFGALATATFARELGARKDLAVASGLLWLTLPAVFMQLPANYVDIGAAAFLVAAACFTLAPPTARNILCAAVALGLFLGSKPNAPLGTVVMFLALGVRAMRAHRFNAVAVAVPCALVLGAESYLTNIVRHHNPIWPVRVDIGALHLPGIRTMQQLLESGAAAPNLAADIHGPMRILRSWVALESPLVFDMRYGGLGLVFLLSLAGAAVFFVRNRSRLLATIVLATLASPDPSVGRYILAFPALTLAMTAAVCSSGQAGIRHERWVATAVWALTALALFALRHAYTGLSGEGPPLAAYWNMSWEERARAVGANGTPAPFLDAQRFVQAGEHVLIDDALDLPYLAWPSDLSHRVEWVATNESVADVAAKARNPNVRIIVARDSSALASLAQSAFQPIFHCKSSPCTVYLRP